MSAWTFQTTLADDTLRAVLPHRAPILMIDSLDVIGDYSAAVGHKTIGIDEPCFVSTEGTGSVAYPRALLAESLGQAAAALWLHRAAANTPEALVAGTLYFAKAEGVVFHRDVFPGDRLEHEIYFEHEVGNTAFMSGRTMCNGEVVVTARSIIAAAR